MAVLRLRFLAISLSSTAIRASTSDRAWASERCSTDDSGYASRSLLRVSWLIFVLALTVLLAITFCLNFSSKKQYFLKLVSSFSLLLKRIKNLNKQNLLNL